jgi:CRP-like cAMP-binding protein
MPAPSIDRLRDIPLFAGLDESALGLVADLTTEFTVPTGHVIVERGYPGLGMFILESGRVAVELRDGRRAELGPGDFFGELSLLTDRERTARVHALTEVICLALSREDFGRLIEAEPQIAAVMLPVVAGRLADLG